MIQIDSRVEQTEREINPYKVSRPHPNFFLLNPDEGRVIVDRAIGLVARGRTHIEGSKPSVNLVVAVAESVAVGQVQVGEEADGRHRTIVPGKVLETPEDLGIKMYSFVISRGNSGGPIFIGNEYEHKVVFIENCFDRLKFGIFSRHTTEVKPVFRKYNNMGFLGIMKTVLAARSNDLEP